MVYSPLLSNVPLSKVVFCVSSQRKSSKSIKHQTEYLKVHTAGTGNDREDLWKMRSEWFNPPDLPNCTPFLSCTLTILAVIRALGLIFAFSFFSSLFW